MTKILLFLWAYPKKWLPNLVDGADDDRWKVDLGERPSGRRYRCHLKRWDFVGLHLRHSWPDELLCKRTKGKRTKRHVTKLTKVGKKTKNEKEQRRRTTVLLVKSTTAVYRKMVATAREASTIINHKTWQFWNHQPQNLTIFIKILINNQWNHCGWKNWHKYYWIFGVYFEVSIH